MSQKAIEIAVWIWKQQQLDPAEESWQGMMLGDAVRMIDKLLSK